MLKQTEGYNLTSNTSFVIYLVVFLLIYSIFLLFNIMVVGAFISAFITFAFYLFQKKSYPGSLQHKISYNKVPNVLYGNRKE